MTLFDPAVDLHPLLAATLAGVCCALLGNFLVLRRLSLMGDAISHSVLPGLVIAFLIASTRSPVVMIVGAGIAGLATVVLVELIKKLGKVEPGAAMGVVFCILFALGVLLIERAAVRHIDLDADCVLHGNLEALGLVRAPGTIGEALRPELWFGYTVEPGGVDPLSGRTIALGLTHGGVPRQVVTLAVMTLVVLTFVGVLFKELRIAAFDPALATTQGYSATLIHYLLMVFVAGATVASFEAVGSILVIAMLICPPATARLLTDRMTTQVVLSAVIAIACAVLGFLGATAVPALWGLDSVNIAGSMAVVAGGLLAVAIVASPRYGVIPKALRRRRMASRIGVDDLLGALYRAAETGVSTTSMGAIAPLLVGRSVENIVARAERSGLVEVGAAGVSLTAVGRTEAAGVIRRHRLWEQYLVDEAGIAPDHVHTMAEQLEHVETAPPGGAVLDPHGRTIPPEES